ncbi:MAG: hypothetical protein K6A68_15310, partial [Clostridiales bacterium]|nr:hypothetical protein [Clostridiales bacterium]
MALTRHSTFSAAIPGFTHLSSFLSIERFLHAARIVSLFYAIFNNLFYFTSEISDKPPVFLAIPVPGFLL